MRNLGAGPVKVTGLEVNHWGARMRTDTHRGYNGYLVQVGNRQIVFAGDTANTSNFRRLPANGKPDLAIFPIGAYNPWIQAHCTPEQAWRMANEARAEAQRGPQDKSGESVIAPNGVALDKDEIAAARRVFDSIRFEKGGRNG